jgi:hypothetical protein
VTDDPYPDDSIVETRFPRADQGPDDRERWPWIPGEIVQRCGENEWQIMLHLPELAVMDDGSVPPPGTPDGEMLFPVVFRDSSEIRKVDAHGRARMPAEDRERSSE